MVLTGCPREANCLNGESSHYGDLRVIRENSEMVTYSVIRCDCTELSAKECCENLPSA